MENLCNSDEEVFLRWRAMPHVLPDVILAGELEVLEALRKRLWLDHNKDVVRTLLPNVLRAALLQATRCCTWSVSLTLGDLATPDAHCVVARKNVVATSPRWPPSWT